MSIDETKLNNFLGKAVGDLGAAISATLMLVGDRLGRLREVVVSGGRFSRFRRAAETRSTARPPQGSRMSVSG